MRARAFFVFVAIVFSSVFMAAVSFGQERVASLHVPQEEGRAWVYGGKETVRIVTVRTDIQIVFSNRDLKLDPARNLARVEFGCSHELPGDPCDYEGVFVVRVNGKAVLPLSWRLYSPPQELRVALRPSAEDDFIFADGWFGKNGRERISLVLRAKDEAAKSVVSKASPGSSLPWITIFEDEPSRAELLGGRFDIVSVRIERDFTPDR